MHKFMRADGNVQYLAACFQMPLRNDLCGPSPPREVSSRPFLLVPTPFADVLQRRNTCGLPSEPPCGLDPQSGASSRQMEDVLMTLLAFSRLTFHFFAALLRVARIFVLCHSPFPLWKGRPRQGSSPRPAPLSPNQTWSEQNPLNNTADPVLGFQKANKGFCKGGPCRG